MRPRVKLNVEKQAAAARRIYREIHSTCPETDALICPVCTVNLAWLNREPFPADGGPVSDKDAIARYERGY